MAQDNQRRQYQAIASSKLKVKWLIVGPGRQFLLLSIMFMVVQSLGTGARAQDVSWPLRPITLIVPFAAGGPVDVVARVVAASLADKLGKPVIVENVGGGGGMIGAARAAKAEPDGYTIVMGNVGTHAGNQTLYRHPLYDAAKDFAPVALVVQLPLVLVARKDFPASDLMRFIAYAKAHASTLQFGSGGTGSTTHLACALLNSAAGISATHIPYKGGGPAMQDLIAGRIDYLCIDPPVARPQIEGNTVKAIAVLSRDRSSSLPSLPTAQEQGVKDIDITNWFALFAPKNTDPAVVMKLHDAIVAAMETEPLQRQLKQIGAELVAPERRSSAYLATFVQSEVEKWAVPIRAGGLQAD
jgi:tripartite-type tricarboxylate transporter receptor subunit TctC